MLENLAGCKIRNAGRILPEHQDLETGNRIRLGPDGFPFFTVIELEPNQALVLRGGPEPPEDDDVDWTWAFIVEKLDGDKSRLLVRNRFDYTPTLANHIMWRGLMDPLAFVMGRKMLKGIKQRAETAG